MLLAIDAGNTNTVFALFEGERLVKQWRIATEETRTGDEYMVWLSQLLVLGNWDMQSIDACIISSVVPQVAFNLRRLGREGLKLAPLVIGDEDVDIGIEVRLSPESGVGADRLANAVGAHLKHNQALIVIDFGTATTFDVVAADGAYEGGLITPGVHLSTKALHEAAAQLPYIEISKPEHVIGKNTIEAMTSGLFWGYVSLIDGLVARIKEEYGQPMCVIATGGLSGVFAPHTDVIEYVSEDLTLHGLVEIYRRNMRPPHQDAQKN